MDELYFKKGKEDLSSLDDFIEKLQAKGPLTLTQEVWQCVETSYDFLQDFSRNKLIYGINTGFGPMAQYRIQENDLKALQYNLIRSHCAGTGAALPTLYVRSIMLCRLQSMLLGASGIHPEVPRLLLACFNAGITPILYEHGSVGASGDLVQLAHLALMLIGEGEVDYRGRCCSAAEALASEQLKPIGIHLREGLSLINGTSAMTGIALLNTHHAWRLMQAALMASALMQELVEAYTDPFSKELNQIKRHAGQQVVAQQIRDILNGSARVRSRDLLYGHKVEENYLEEKVQEYYSLRCVPQILGPILDTLQSVESIVVDELNSVNDNPIVDVEARSVFHGGNFHGDYISLEMDKLKIAMTRLSMLMERQLNYLLNHQLNHKFPPFLNMGVLGLNLGMQGVQFTATSTTAENQSLSFPNYVHSIPNNNDNQDIVSMGTNSACITKKVIENTYEVLAIHLMGLLQAVDCAQASQTLAPRTREFYETLRALVPVFVEDTTKHREIAKLKDYLMNTMDLWIRRAML